MMTYELYVGLRYTRTRRRDNFVSTISVISMVGIALSVAALIVVLSVVNGFQREFRDRILAAAAHVQIGGFDGWIENWPALVAQATALPGVLAAAPYIDAQGMLSSGPVSRGALLRGVRPDLDRKVVDLDKHVIKGRLDDLAQGRFAVILGADLAGALGVSTGDRVTLVAPQPEGGDVSPRLRDLEVVGIVSVGLYEFDSTLALMNMDDLAALEGLGTRVSGVRLRLADPFMARVLARRIANTIPDVLVTDWTRSHLNLFQAVQTSKTMLVIILALIVTVAAFNIVATLVMAVLDKEADIAILRTLGATPGAILRIFMVQGALIGIIGTIAGVALGVVLALNAQIVVKAIETVLGFHFLSPQVYQIGELPSELRLGDVTLTALAALLLSFAATIYPSWRATRVRPAEVLRYE
jgi:lipoprotein-releasing system permease protein